jgi:hypothetical protein
MRDRYTGLVVALSAAVSIAAAAAIAVASSGGARDAYETWAQQLQTAAADRAHVTPGADPVAADGESLLMIVGDERGKGIALAVLTAAGDGALLAVLPGSMYDLLPGYGIFPIEDALTFGGPDLAALAVANTLGIGIGAVLVVPAAELPVLIEGDIAVDLPNPLLVESDGTIVRLAAEGSQLRSPDAVASLFTERGSTELLAFLERQVAAWRGMVSHVAQDQALAASFAALAGSGADLGASLLTAAGNGLEVTLIPVGQVGGGDDEGFEPRSQEIATFVQRRMPQLARWSGERPRVEILNGNGRLTTTSAVANILVAQGFRVVRTDNAENFDFAITVVLAQGEEHTDVAREVVRLLGAGELRLEARAPSGIVDVSIIVGHDIPTGEG